ncbi:TIGR02206 family membrane protein [Lederbergia wuyishanensis]|uniref:Integral membrane protein (TIGR02206 family) n=1 Tax=Lederbergia wuyishanensis TaxID=1347903 RepID=A0ABU0D8J0_9BACI|nr:TIGR02206 family membrane protein [Lederbergia wuyishanensis]MCJ8009186.1 TIGR02206 family membrane protein [Lederbergia wuyishanensis]MDQ0344685.1 putative integral membrane protein (TIGR02206 family) [Lederbergia wuyishanensis]
MGDTNEAAFVMFSTAHFASIIVLFLSLLLLLIFRKLLQSRKLHWIERIFALTLLLMEILYHLWLIRIGRWSLIDSLPLELCSVSLIMAILLLCTGNKHIYDFVFYAGIGGAIQAIATPDLDLSFPHFRYFHFFYTHIGIVITALYFTWVKGYAPTFKGIIKTLVILNILLPLIFTVNYFFNGNYMFLKEKPVNGSLLDFLGPYPWYILSLEAVALVIFIILWLLFRNNGLGERKRMGRNI